VKRESNEGRLIPRAFFALALKNGLEYHYLYVSINSNDDQAKSDYKFGGLLISTARVQLCTTGVQQVLIG